MEDATIEEATIEDATMVQPASSHLVLRSLDTNTAFPLAGEILVGREVECTITLDSAHISRYHSKISVSPNGIFIEDLKSTNGTFVNGKRINQRAHIGIGDEIAFHEIPFRIVSEESGDADATLMGSMPKPEQPIPNPTTSSPDTSPQMHAGNVTSAAPVHNFAQQNTIEEDADDESTQILSATELNRFVNRNQQAQRDVKVGSGARLIVMTAPLRGKVYSLENDKLGTQWHIGRQDSADISIHDKTISSEHAKISKVPNGYLLSTLAAKNGVIINGISQDRTFLSHNDKIQLGRIELIFKNDKTPDDNADEDELLNDQLKSTRRLVIGAMVTLTGLVGAVLVSMILS